MCKCLAWRDRVRKSGSGVCGAFPTPSRFLMVCSGLKSQVRDSLPSPDLYVLAAVSNKEPVLNVQIPRGVCFGGFCFLFLGTGLQFIPSTVVFVNEWIIF